jgi:hypothetical protein
MEFRLVLEKLLSDFERQNIGYALIGGFALGLWGYGRATVDVDFLVIRDDMPKVNDLMNHLGYECRYKSDNVSQYISPLKIFGEVDFVHAFRNASIAMLERAENKAIFDGALTIRVLKPEDIIGLKMQAMKNDKSRFNTDLSDIKMLLKIQKNRIDYGLLESYIKLLDMEDIWTDVLKEADE